MGDAADHSVVVELLGIRKQFPGVLANNDSSLQILQGERFAISGENGAGKTTLMNICLGLYRRHEGKISGIRGAGGGVQFAA